MGKSRVYRVLSELNTLKWSIAYKGVLAGLVSGLLVALYRIGIEFGTESAIHIYRYLGEHPVYMLPWLALIVLVGYLAYRLIKLEPFSKGSGIPQVEGVVLLGMKMKWLSILVVRFIAGIFTSFFGVSLGREGPSIQIGAAGAQMICEKTCKNKVEENYLITAGASAGLSAAFNAPLSGIMFSLEEVHRTFSPNILIAATTAALTADVVSKYFFGLNPVLNYIDVPQIPIQYYIWLLPMGILSGIVGAITNKGLLRAGQLYEKLPAFLRPMIALLLALPIGILLPQVLGGGQGLIKISETMQAGTAMLLVYLVMKLVFTCTSFGSGIPGGIFMPILSIGALSGCIFGKMVTNFGLPVWCVPAFSVCAMAGVMSGSVKSPITSILLMAEMSGSLVHLFPVAATAFIALLTSDILKVSPIYEVLLERISEKRNPKVPQGSAGALLEMPVELGSIVAGKRVSEIEWPEGALVVSLHRGKHEVIPKGKTKILQGDYLVVLSSELRYEEMSREIAALCRTQD